MGLVTLPQLSGAMAQQAATGRPLEELLVEMGLVSADDLAKLEEPTAPAAAVAAPVTPPPDAAVPAAAPVAAPALPPETPPLIEVPAPAPAPAPVPTAQHFALVAELENGSKLDLGVYADLQQARDAATYAMRAIRDAGSDWPILGGRYVRPESVLAIEVTALL
jgi:hypothetical protein